MPRVVLPALLAALPSIAYPASFYVATDVPSSLGGGDYTPNQAAKSSAGAYSLALTLDATVSIAALHRRNDGVWLFTPADPVILGGIPYEPRDVVSFDSATYAMVLDGSAAGIPDYARIDGLHEEAGTLYLSFDVPVASLGGADYGPSDVVSYAGSFALYWDAGGAGVPTYANACGLLLRPGGRIVLSFDVPVRLGSADYVPGQLVEWDGSAFASYALDPSWPAYAQARGIAPLPPPGTVPDGAAVPGTPLSATKSGSDVALSWGSSCSTFAEDYAVYEGALGSFTSRNPSLCTTGGITSATVTPLSGDRYFLVVPRHTDAEGSYGTNSSGAERPPSASACVPQEIAACP